jgi:hypothetical protein
MALEMFTLVGGKHGSKECETPLHPSVNPRLLVLKVDTPGWDTFSSLFREEIMHSIARFAAELKS